VRVEFEKEISAKVGERQPGKDTETRGQHKTVDLKIEEQEQRRGGLLELLPTPGADFPQFNQGKENTQTTTPPK
jgi:hypothetical protein